MKTESYGKQMLPYYVTKSYTVSPISFSYNDGCGNKYPDYCCRMNRCYVTVNRETVAYTNQGAYIDSKVTKNPISVNCQTLHSCSQKFIQTIDSIKKKIHTSSCEGEISSSNMQILKDVAQNAKLNLEKLSEILNIFNSLNHRLEEKLSLIDLKLCHDNDEFNIKDDITNLRSIIDRLEAHLNEHDQSMTKVKSIESLIHKERMTQGKQIDILLNISQALEMENNQLRHDLYEMKTQFQHIEESLKLEIKSLKSTNERLNLYVNQYENEREELVSKLNTLHIEGNKNIPCYVQGVISDQFPSEELCIETPTITNDDLLKRKLDGPSLGTVSTVASKLKFSMIPLFEPKKLFKRF